MGDHAASGADGGGSTPQRTSAVIARLRALHAEVSRAHGRGAYTIAAALTTEALTLARGTLGPRHPWTLGIMRGLAVLYQTQRRYNEAEPLFEEALAGRREAFGPQPPDTLTSTNELAVLYHAQGRHAEAEPLFREALEGGRA